MPEVCIHGHFYQPPREDPWTGVIGRQPSAAPFPDWNQRITAECYRACLRAPVLDGEGNEIERVNCWEHLAFDVGPTLMRWMHEHAPDVHAGIVDADHAAVRRTGHGNALAQGYHHAILPLCTDRDRKTEILWGLRDFSTRFGRHAEGIWLPECAADVPTLCAVADAGVDFVVLAPRQAAELADPRRAWALDLPGERALAGFFYDGGPAQGVAFGGWLHDGIGMAHKLAAGEGLVHFATDGESYGHHHRHGEMALATVVRTLRQLDVSMTNHGAWLAAQGVEGRMGIVSPSSWSCANGVGRWSRDCGCGTEPGGGGWRVTLREGLNAHRERIDDWWVDQMAAHGVSDPWALRDAFVWTLLAEEGFAVDDPLSDEEPALRKLLEVQNQRLMMFTSCGWFFDSPYGLEAQQILKYAKRAAELSGIALPPELEALRR